LIASIANIVGIYYDFEDHFEDRKAFKAKSISSINLILGGKRLLLGYDKRGTEDKANNVVEDGFRRS